MASVLIFTFAAIYFIEDTKILYWLLLGVVIVYFFVKYFSLKRMYAKAREEKKSNLDL